jgi:hypothetical protein
LGAQRLLEAMCLSFVFEGLNFITNALAGSAARGRPLHDI